jgi:hypothetical protein
VQTLYQPLFSNSPLAILLQQSLSLQQLIFPLQQSLSPAIFPSKGLPHPKSQKSLVSSLSESFIPSGKQGGGAMVLREGRDIVKEKPVLNNLGKTAELHLGLICSPQTIPSYTELDSQLGICLKDTFCSLPIFLVSLLTHQF